MKLVPTRPVTIERVRYGERWFPYLFRHTDNSLLLYVQYGHDGNFSPAFRIRSTDEGRTWGDPVDHVPRQCWSQSFSNGELFEIDTYGVQDPKSPQTAVYYGAWSFPGRLPDEPTRALVRVHTPSLRAVPLNEMLAGYPSFPWWPLWNGLWGREDMSAKEIKLLGPVFTGGVEMEDGRLVALAYGSPHDAPPGKSCVVALESRDRGHNWNEIAIASRDDATPEGPDEATLVRLKDGRLYCVARTGDFLYHNWSGDGGRTWTKPEPMQLIDSDHRPGMVWPVVKVLSDGTLVMVYGRMGKDVVFDPTGTGTGWRGRLDLTAWERDTQTLRGVPPEKQLRRDDPSVRYWDSSDYLALVPCGPRSCIVMYDVQHYREDWNSKPVSGVRMLTVTLE